MSLDPRAVEMVTTAHKRQLALRFEVSALTAAVAAGHTTTVGQQAYALTWLAEYAAERILELAKAPEGAIDPHSASWRDGYDTGFAEGDSGVFNSDGSYKDEPPTPRLVGQEAEQQHGTAVPTKDAAGKGGTPGRAPNPQTPQGAAGTPTPRASRK